VTVISKPSEGSVFSRQCEKVLTCVTNSDISKLPAVSHFDRIGQLVPASRRVLLGSKVDATRAARSESQAAIHAVDPPHA
jgi:hypothetical protein